MARMIIIDEQRCMGCKTCVLECAMAHSDASSLAEALRSPDRPQPRIHVEPSERFGVPLQCRHCEDAPCMEVCPTEAITRPAERGPVLIQAERCIGCKFCMLVCPFGVIDLSRDGKAMIKCDLCIERTQAGQEPACAAACPTGALEFCEMDEWLSRRRRSAAAKVSSAGKKAQQIVSEKADGR